MPRLDRHTSGEIPVVFRYRPPHHVPFVDLRGDMLHWNHIERMAPVDGAHEATLRLGSGVYSYKFHVGSEAWVLDPDNPRTRAREGSNNSLLVIGGADEPVLHAPVRPYLFADDEGCIRLRAGLRRGHGERLVVRWDEGHGPHETELVGVADEDEHRLFEGRLPASARAIEYVFVVPGGRVVGRSGGAGQAFRVLLATLGSPTPAWWRQAVLYTLFVDRFRRGGQHGAWGELPANDRARVGGDLDGVTEALGYLADLGVNTLHLTPIVVAPSAHRYDAVDLRRVDPALGGEAALARLLDQAHRRNLRVLLDLPVTHVHRDFFAFVDVRTRGFQSPYAPWFTILQHPFHEGFEPGYAHYPRGQWQEPMLRTDEPEVIAYLAETAAHWARLGADGFRVDAAADVPLELLRHLVEAARGVRPDVVFVGEVIPGNLPRYTSGVLDAATDFPAQEALLDWIARRRASARVTAERLARRRFDRGGLGSTAILFTATHDQHRLLTHTRDARVARLGQLLVLLGATVPALLYGDEIGMVGTEHSGRNFDDAWPDRRPMPWDPAMWDAQTLALVQGALALRRAHAALSQGDEAWMALQPLDGDGSEDVLALRRSHTGTILDVILHAGEGTRRVALPGGAPSSAERLLALGDAEFEPASGVLRLGAWSAAVLARVAPQQAIATFQALVEHTRTFATLAFREGLTTSSPLPSSLYLTVTERCNLRCMHCITDAPARTAEGRARHMQPWLLDALREALAAADYVGFVHGGEALVAPLFPALLRTIRQSRAGKPTNVHLLSNGMLLDRETTRRLIALGVNSLSISLDGALAATNDRLRLGGRFDTVIEHLRDVVRVRDESNADLRVGISTVVTAGNVGELAALGRWVVALGLDWLKVEELFPCTPTARHEMVYPHEPAVERAMAELRETLAKTPVVLVDHRDPPMGCGCQARADPALAAFRAADDFANRTPFHPCRAAWEQACVDPDGTVHAVDYATPALGNLSEVSFPLLWNGTIAAQIRSAALRRTSPGMRRTCGILPTIPLSG